MQRTAYLGLGSNVASKAGDPAQTVQAAVNALAALGTVMAQSSLYETQPVENTQQPVFINAVVALRTELEPEVLLAEMMKIERVFGRDRLASTPKGPRTLDLDLLLMDELVMESETLTLPHPALAERRFVLAPLAEIAPELRHPVRAKTIAELLAALPEEGPNARSSVRAVESTPRRT
jgi:2-amino-4-hydroxy-6-hydroxymethyldihydropteridine diphosphokinase